jgi:hypothetical protein
MLVHTVLQAHLLLFHVILAVTASLITCPQLLETVWLDTTVMALLYYPTLSMKQMEIYVPKVITALLAVLFQYHVIQVTSAIDLPMKMKATV